MMTPILKFRSDAQHYQTDPANAWTAVVDVEIQPSGWVKVEYKDGAVLLYPPSAFEAIVVRSGPAPQAPAEEKTSACPYDHAHTPEWCGYSDCRRG